MSLLLGNGRPIATTRILYQINKIYIMNIATSLLNIHQTKILKNIRNNNINIKITSVDASVSRSKKRFFPKIFAFVSQILYIRVGNLTRIIFILSVRGNLLWVGKFLPLKCGNHTQTSHCSAMSASKTATGSDLSPSRPTPEHDLLQCCTTMEKVVT